MAPGGAGSGSTFWFTAHLPAGEGTSSAEEPPASVPGVLHGRVLVAEDNLVNQQVATLMLEDLGLVVDVVGDGRAALDAACAGGYDVVLMDCQMPVMDGLQAARAMRERGCTPPVLALTASASRQDELACRDAGMRDYLTKPIHPQALAAALSRHLPQQRPAS